MKTAELTKAALDWAVAQAAGYTTSDLDLLYDIKSYDKFNPSTDWSQGGPIIEREKLDVFWNPEIDKWSIAGWDERGKREVIERHESMLVAAMRCYVASKLGDEVDVPKELT